MTPIKQRAADPGKEGALDTASPESEHSAAGTEQQPLPAHVVFLLTALKFNCITPERAADSLRRELNSGRAA